MEEKESNKRLYWILISIGVIPFLLNGYINSLIYTNPWLYWSFEILIWTLVPSMIFYFAIKKGNLKAADIGLSTNIMGRNSLFLVIAFCILFPPIEFFIYKLCLAYSTEIFTRGHVFSYFSVIPESGISRFMVIWYFALSAGIVEELYYRGLLYKISQFYSYPNLIYLTISPLIFSLIHWENGAANVAATYVFGVILAIVFIVIKNIWPLIMGHIFTDYVWFN